MNVSSWSIRNPTRRSCCSSCSRCRAAGLPGDEGAELPRHRPAHGQRHRQLPGAAPAQLETEVARKIENSLATCRASSTSTPRCRTARHGHGRVPPGETHAGGGGRRARRRLAHPLRPAGRPARPGGRQAQPGRHAGPHLHRGLRLAWTTRRCPGSSTTQVTKACWRARRGRGRRAWAASRARCGGARPGALLALGATAADISRQLRQVQQEASGGRTDLGGAEQSVRTIATVQSAEELAALEVPLSDGRASASTRSPRSATPWPSGAAARC
jgi:hypothetical protein